MDTIERIKKLRDLKGLTTYGLSKSIGVDSGNFSKSMNGKGNISEYVLMKIASTYHVSLDWLKTGEGEMYEQRPMSTEEMMQVTNRYGMHVVGANAVQNNGTAASSGTLLSLEAEVAALKARLEEKDKQIEMLLGLLRSNNNK